MEGKLIKLEESKYTLVYKEGNIAWENNPAFDGKLSLKNCEAIENGYDLDELAENNYPTFNLPLTDTTAINTLKQDSFKEGFQKALEILGGKKFSEEDMIEFAKWTFLEVGSNTGKDRTNEQLLLEWKSIQQTEFDVEIVMVKTPDGIFRENDVPYASPKLDAENCLILKRK